MKIVKNMVKAISPELHGWLYDMLKGPRRYHHLYDSIKALQAKNILEVGVWNGKRALKMIEVARKNQTDVKYYGFDLFEGLSEEMYKEELSKRPPSKKDVEELLKTTGAQIHLYSGNTVASLPKVAKGLPVMDFIFIDGGHSNQTVSSDWESVRQLMDEKTIVIFDDYWRNRVDGGSKLTVDAINTDEYDVEVLSEIDCFNNVDFGRLEISFAKVKRRLK